MAELTTKTLFIPLLPFTYKINNRNIFNPRVSCCDTVFSLFLDGETRLFSKKDDIGYEIDIFGNKIYGGNKIFLNRYQDRIKYNVYV